MKLLLTGGHITPAIATIQYLKLNQITNEESVENTIQIIFIGRKFSMSKQQQQSHEQKLISELGVEFYNLESPRRVGLTLLNTVSSAISLLKKIKPDVVLSFGSYFAVPIVIAAWLLNIPIVTHEQTRIAGNANRLISFFASKVAISFIDSAQYFPRHKTVLTGNPIRQELLNLTQNSQPKWYLETQFPMILVLGGNQGSYALNSLIRDNLTTLTKEFQLVIATGNPTSEGNFEEQFSELKKTLPLNQQPNLLFRNWIDVSDLGWLYQHCAVCLSRSGANTVQELIVTQTPSVLVPLPFAKNDEQVRNAELLTSAKVGIIVHQKNLSIHTLTAAVRTIMSERDAIKKRFFTLQKNNQAAANLAQLLNDVYLAD